MGCKLEAAKKQNGSFKANVAHIMRMRTILLPDTIQAILTC